jgi:hypothetical protein
MQVLELQSGESNSGRFLILLLRTIPPVLRSPTLESRTASRLREVLRWPILPHDFVPLLIRTEH